MRVAIHPSLAVDIESILDWLSSERPAAIEPLQRHIDEAIARISVWPELAPSVLELGSDIRVLTLTRNPYRIFYRVKPDVVEILYIRHTSRAPWEGGR